MSFDNENWKQEWTTGEVITANKLNALKDAVVNIDGTVTTINTTVTEHSGDINSIKSTIGNISIDVNNIESEIENARNYGSSTSGSLGTRIDELVQVSATQPTGNNEIWVNTEYEEFSVPTYEEFDQLLTVLNTGITVPIVWEQGQCNADTGADRITSHDYAIRSKGVIPVDSFKSGLTVFFADVPLPSGATNIVAAIYELNSVSPSYSLEKRTVIYKTGDTKTLTFSKNTIAIRIALYYLTAGQHEITPNMGHLCTAVWTGTALDEMQQYSFTAKGAGVKQILEDEDFNNYQTPGNYRVPDATVAGTLLNRPCDSAGRLFVLQYVNSTKRLQIYFDINGNIWLRAYDGTIWAPSWKDIVNENGVPDYIQANSSELGELVLKEKELYRVYNPQSGQSTNARLSKTTIANELLTQKQTVTSAQNINILPTFARHDEHQLEGIHYTWKNYNHLHIEGETSSKTSFYNLFVSRTEMLPGMELNENFLMKIENNPDNTFIRIYWYDEIGLSNGESFKNQEVKETQLICPPNNAVGLLIRFEIAKETSIDPSGVDVKLELLMHPTKKHIRILCIGNSYTNDCTSYAPYIVENISDVCVTMGTSYYSGAGIDDYLGWFDNESAVLQYHKRNALAKTWTSTDLSDKKTLQKIIADEPWDIITFQQKSAQAAQAWSFGNLNELIDKVTEEYYSVHGKSVRVGWLMPQLRYDSPIENGQPYSLVAKNIKDEVLAKTPIDFVIPCGTAIEIARGTSLDAIGAAGHLSADENGHLQEGLPSLLANYVSAAKILELCGEPWHGILHEDTRPTQEWVNDRNIPGKNGNSIDDDVTEEEYLLAQKCAIAALKEPLKVTDDLTTEDIELAAITPELNITLTSQNSENVATFIFDNATGKIKAYGKAPITRRILCLNGQKALRTTSGDFDATFTEKGVYQLETEITGYLSTNLRWVYTYSTFGTHQHITVSKENPIDTVEILDPVMFGLLVVEDTDFGTEANPTYITFSAKKKIAADLVARKILNNEVVKNDTLYKYNFYNAIELGNGKSREYQGITYINNNNGTWTIDGETANASSFCNIIESVNTIPDYIILGRKYKLNFYGKNIPLRLYLYKNDGTNSYVTYTEDSEIIFPEDTIGLILRFQIDQNKIISNEIVKYTLIPEAETSIDNYYTYNTTVQKTEQIINNTYDANVAPIITTDTHGWLESSNEMNDRTSEIMAMLNSTGYCHLGEGTFYVSGNIDMPNGSMLCGCGNNTVIKLLESEQPGYCIKMQVYNTLANLRISGSDSSLSELDLSEEGIRNGILYTTENTNADRCVMENIWIDNFSGSGIKCNNTSKTVAKAIYATNIYVTKCWAGVNIEQNSEFHKFTNLCTYRCTYGCINNSGNNVFTACTFHASLVGFYIDGTQPNSGHGTINGCTFCHIGSNTGSALLLENIGNGFIVNGSQFWYNSIGITNCSGINFVGCEFGRGISESAGMPIEGATININGGNLIMFTGCQFMKDLTYPPHITKINNTKVRFNSCYGSESGNAITA